jgi:hypothetical protein
MFLIVGQSAGYAVSNILPQPHKNYFLSGLLWPPLKLTDHAILEAIAKQAWERLKNTVNNSQSSHCTCDRFRHLTFMNSGNWDATVCGYGWGIGFSDADFISGVVRRSLRSSAFREFIEVDCRWNLVIFDKIHSIYLKLERTVCMFKIML